MNVQLQGNEQITKLFNDWYRAILQHQTTHATKIKKDIENIISNSEEDTNLQLYYSLFNFRYKILTDGLNINKDDFNKIDSFPLPYNGYFLIIIIFSRLFTIQLLETTMQQNTFSRTLKSC